MRQGVWGKWLAVATLALAPLAAAAQDVTLSSRDGALAVAGTLISFDGELYRIDSEFGPLAIDAAAVLCSGPGCPSLIAPKSVIRIAGDAAVADALLPPLIAAFARAKGLDLRAPAGLGAPTQLVQTGSDTVLAEFYFTPAAPQAARAGLADQEAELVLARFAPEGSTARVLALDALIPIVAPSNPLARLSTADLAAALSGSVSNWQQFGGPDMPLVLHGLQTGSDLAQAVAARLGQSPAFDQTHADLPALAAAVARDPWALGVTGRADVGPARAMTLTDSCGFVLSPSPLSVKAEDYPLTLPIYFLTPPRRLPLMAREFLEFLAMPDAQAAIAQAGFVARDVISAPLASDGARLISAIKTMPDAALLQRLAAAMEGADRLSLTFRFDDGSPALDLASQENLTDLAQRIEAGQFARAQLMLVGFAPSTGDAGRDFAASNILVEGVLAALAALLPSTAPEDLPQIDAFGAALPMACDTTKAGQRLNRRVEVWLRPNP